MGITKKWYSYPDEQDKMIAQFIREKDERYWEESENVIIELIIKYFDLKLPRTGRKFFDAGCGTGRLIPRFAEYFDEIVGVEPDIKRYKQAIEFMESQKLAHKTHIFHASLPAYQALSKDQADFVLCSHVIQHIESHAVKPFLNALAKMVSPQGLLAITTNHSTRPDNYFIKSFLKNGMTSTEEISEEAFNQINSGTGFLPVQFFNYDKLVEFLQNIGLNVLEFRVFHVEEKDRDLVKPDLSDDYFNATAERQKKYGADMLILLQKS